MRKQGLLDESIRPRPDAPKHCELCISHLSLLLRGLVVMLKHPVSIVMYITLQSVGCDVRLFGDTYLRTDSVKILYQHRSLSQRIFQFDEVLIDLIMGFMSPS